MKQPKLPVAQESNISVASKLEDTTTATQIIKDSQNKDDIVESPENIDITKTKDNINSGSLIHNMEEEQGTIDQSSLKSIEQSTDVDSPNEIQTHNGESASIQNSENNGPQEKIEDPLKLVKISFPTSTVSFGPALKEIFSQSVKVHKPQPMCIKFDSVREAEQKLSEIENTLIGGKKLEAMIAKTIFDPLKRVTVISTKININMKDVSDQLGAKSHEILKTASFIAVYALQFNTEDEALAADKLHLVIHDYSIRLRPFRIELNKRENEAESPDETSTKKLKVDEVEKMEDDSNVEEKDDDQTNDDDDQEIENNDQEVVV